MSNQRGVALTVRTTTGQAHDIVLPEDAHGSDLLSRIVRLGYPENIISRVVFQGQEVDRERTLREMGIITGSVVHVVIRLRGD